MILGANPKAQYLRHKADVDAAVSRVLESGWYILGEEVRAFEAEFARYVGVAHAIGVGSGTEALHLALAACGIGSGDEVITVSHTAVATVAAVELAGATPVLVDIEPDFYTLDPSRIEEAITRRTRAIIPVHLYGQPADLEPILDIASRYSLRVVEDCAQAHGASCMGKRVGSHGDMGCFSFYPTKNLGALGDGGMVVTNNPDLDKQVRLLREYGWTERFVSTTAGLNSRLDEVQAAILHAKLRSLDDDNARRAAIARAYEDSLTDCGLELPAVRGNASHVFHQYVVRSPQRDSLKAFLHRNGIGAGVHYPVPVHLQPAYAGRLPVRKALPVTEKAAQEILSLPIHPDLTEDEVQIVVATVREFAQAHKSPGTTAERRQRQTSSDVSVIPECAET